NTSNSDNVLTDTTSTIPTPTIPIMISESLSTQQCNGTETETTSSIMALGSVSLTNSSFFGIASSGITASSFITSSTLTTISISTISTKYDSATNISDIIERISTTNAFTESSFVETRTSLSKSIGTSTLSISTTRKPSSKYVTTTIYQSDSYSYGVSYSIDSQSSVTSKSSTRRSSPYFSVLNPPNVTIPNSFELSTTKLYNTTRTSAINYSGQITTDNSQSGTLAISSSIGGALIVLVGAGAFIIARRRRRSRRTYFSNVLPILQTTTITNGITDLRRYCELCKHPFQFRSVYREDMPNALPLSVFLLGMLKRLAMVLKKFSRYWLAVFVWSILTPQIAYRIFFYLSGITLVEETEDMDEGFKIVLHNFLGTSIMLFCVGFVMSVIFFRDAIATHQTLDEVQ
ncbi:hypothetical protein ROZALSC1DRAFT_25457, partial [Rozella allomycis CSF55]